MIPSDKDKFLGVLLAWLVPGAGHYYMGQRWKGIILFCLIASSYVVGMAMADFRNVGPGHAPQYLAAQLFSGLPTAIAVLATHHLTPLPIWYPQGHHLGCLLTCVASLLNLAAIYNIYQNDVWGQKWKK